MAPQSRQTGAKLVTTAPAAGTAALGAGSVAASSFGAGSASGTGQSDGMPSANSQASGLDDISGLRRIKNMGHTAKLAISGGIAGAFSKTCTAPLARLTILYQVRTRHIRTDPRLAAAACWRTAGRQGRTADSTFVAYSTIRTPVGCATIYCGIYPLTFCVATGSRLCCVLEQLQNMARTALSFLLAALLPRTTMTCLRVLALQVQQLLLASRCGYLAAPRPFAIPSAPLPVLCTHVLFTSARLHCCRCRHLPAPRAAGWRLP